MKIENRISKIINNYNSFDAEIKAQTDLATDMGLDSLSIIMFLEEIEREFGISFEISEISKCLKLDSLIALVKSKIQGK